MSGLFGALEIGKRALFTGQAGLNVTGQNIANANTPGYARRVLDQTPVPGARLAEGILGGGVDAERIRRARDEQIENRLLRAHADLGRAATRAGDLSEIESLVGSLEEGSLSESLRGFLDAWQELSVAPESMTLRQAAVTAGGAVAASLNRLSDGLSDMKGRAAERALQGAASVNASISRIAEISRRIASAESGNAIANDLRDQRGREIEELSKAIDVNFTEAPNGSFLLRVGGVVVADGERSFSLKLETAAAAARQGTAGLSAPGASGGLVLSVEGVALAPASGSLRASLDAVNSEIAGYISRLDEIAAGLADSVNAIHEAGYGLDGASGRRFFELPDDGSGLGAAARIRVATALVEDPRAVAASASGDSGNNETARALAGLDTALSVRGGTRSVTQLAAEFSDAVARDTAEAAFFEEAGSAFVASLENRRDQISGVSLDEEAVNLIKYQQAYEAAARVIAVTSQMLDTLLSEV